MREIKFRAWVVTDWDEKDRPRKYKMVEWSNDFFSDSSIVTGYSDEFPTEPYCYLMQYTGLKDKNGVEIYEGDIVGFSSLSEEVSKVYDIPNFPVLHIVEYVDCYFMARRIDAPNLLIGLFNIASVSNIFGNIYENPELLGGE